MIMYYEMAKIGKKLVDKGLVELQFGNMSLRKKKKILITRKGIRLDDINMNSVVEIDIDRSSESDKVASSETIVHRAIYENTAASAIIHAHPMFAVIESMLADNDKLVPVTIEGEHFLGNIPVVRGAPGSSKLAECIALALVNHKGVIVSGHGTFAIGETLEEAYFNTALIEQSCKMKYYFDLVKEHNGKNKNLNKQIRTIASGQGIEYLGFADLSPAHNAILEQGGSFIASFPFSISIGIPLLNPIVDLLPQREERAVKVGYRHYAYDIVNLRLDLAASIISGHLQQSGFKALPIPASKRVDDERICASFSHKLGAHLAGLGWIGKSCLFITPEYGPRVRWATILTDAPLEPAVIMQQEQCKDCRECIDICPIGAFTGKPFRADEPREARYDAKKCEKYFDSMEQKDEIAVCGLCLFVCPFGQKRKT